MNHAFQSKWECVLQSDCLKNPSLWTPNTFVDRYLFSLNLKIEKRGVHFGDMDTCIIPKPTIFKICTRHCDVMVVMTSSMTQGSVWQKQSTVAFSHLILPSPQHDSNIATKVIVRKNELKNQSTLKTMKQHKLHHSCQFSYKCFDFYNTEMFVGQYRFIVNGGNAYMTGIWFNMESLLPGVVWQQ